MTGGFGIGALGFLRRGVCVRVERRFFLSAAAPAALGIDDRRRRDAGDVAGAGRGRP